MSRGADGSGGRGARRKSGASGERPRGALTGPLGVLPGGGRPRIALGVSGGIAAYKAAEIVRGLVKAGAEVHVIMTAGGRQFITPLTLQTLSGQDVITDQWDLTRGADIQHIALTKGLDLMLVAPATADILAKFAHGIADDFLSTFYLAVTAPVLVAPAMNVWMWEHPATQANLTLLKGRGVRVLEPEAGSLACGDEGIGRMADPESIVAAALGTGKKKLRGRLKDAASS
ncbi:MAG TPA: flavoprotein [Candidatus Binatia bacterium]|nr:flavoprotein [Candidatus Binatia bacterium]